MGYLMDYIFVICNVRIIDLVEKIRELLVQGTAGVKSGDSVHHYLQPAQASGSSERNVDLLVINASLDSWGCQGLGNVCRGESVHFHLLDCFNGSKASQKAT